MKWLSVEQAAATWHTACLFLKHRKIWMMCRCSLWVEPAGACEHARQCTLKSQDHMREVFVPVQLVTYVALHFKYLWVHATYLMKELPAPLQLSLLNNVHFLSNEEFRLLLGQGTEPHYMSVYSAKHRPSTPSPPTQHPPHPPPLKIFSKQAPLSPLKRDPLSNAKWLSWPALTVGHLLHKRSWSVK